MESQNDNNDIYSKRVKAGKRTYFFDIKATRAKDYYLIITESRKKFRDDEQVFEKQKLFLYKEDLNRFLAALTHTAEHMKTKLIPDYDFDQFNHYDDEAYTSKKSR